MEERVYMVGKGHEEILFPWLASRLAYSSVVVEVTDLWLYWGWTYTEQHECFGRRYGGIVVWERKWT